MSEYISKSKAYRKERYLLQAGEAPLPFPQRLDWRLHRAYGRLRSTADTSADNLVTGGSVPASGVDSAAAPSTLGDGGATGSHLSEVVRSPSLSSSSEDEFTIAGGGGEGERPCCSHSQYYSLY
jgi:hypothetical protein